MTLPLYLTTFFALSTIVVITVKREGLLFFPNYFYAYLALCHTLVPASLMLGGDAYRSLLRERVFHVSTIDHLSFLILLWSAALAFPLGWKVGGNIPLLTIYKSSQPAEDLPEGQSAIVILWIILVTGLGAFLLYFSAFGGIFDALAVARLYRSGAIEIPNPFAFLRPVGDFTTVASVLFIALWSAGRRGFLVLLGVAVSTPASLLMLVFLGGRLGLAQFAALVLIVLASSGRISLFRSMLICGLLVLLLLFGYQVLFFFYGLFSYAEYQAPSAVESLSPVEFFVVELSFPSTGMATAINSVESGTIDLRYGIDVAFGILSILPASLLGADFERIGVVHTAVANPDGSASIPVDMMMYGVYSFYLAGPAIFAFLVGLVPKLAFRYVERIPWPRARFALSTYFLILFARHLVYFDPAMSINRIYFLVICTVMIYAFSRAPIVRT